MAKRGAAAEASVSSDEPVSVQCSQQDRREGAGFRAGAFPLGGAEPRLFGALRHSPARRAGAGCRRARPARPLRGEDRAGGPVPADGGRHVVLRPWRRDVPEIRPGWADHGDGFHPRAYGDFDGSGLCRPRQFFPDLGARTACAPMARRCGRDFRDFGRGRSLGSNRNDGGPRRGQPRGWRTGPSHSGSPCRSDLGARSGRGSDDRRRHVRGGRLHQGDTCHGRIGRRRRPRPRCNRGGTRTRSCVRRQAEAGARSILEARRLCRTGRRRRARHRRFVDADRRGGARLFLPRRRAARHAHGAGRPERRRRRQPLQVGRSRAHLRLSRRGDAMPAASPA